MILHLSPLAQDAYPLYDPFWFAEDDDAPCPSKVTETDEATETDAALDALRQARRRRRGNVPAALVAALSLLALVMLAAGAGLVLSFLLAWLRGGV